MPARALTATYECSHRAGGGVGCVDTDPAGAEDTRVGTGARSVGVVSAGCPAAELLRRLAGLRDQLSDCLPLAEAIGSRGASVFIAGARGNIGHACAELAGAAVEGAELRSAAPLLSDYGVALRRNAAATGLLTRVRLARDTEPVDDAVADGDDGEPLPNLGVDLVADAELKELARRPVFAALLADALARHTWLHRGSRSIWSGGAGAARAVVAVAGGGRHFPDLSAARLDGLVDQEVSAALARLGWVRLGSPRPPGWTSTSTR